jgi:hypothetical protein
LTVNTGTFAAAALALALATGSAQAGCLAGGTEATNRATRIQPDEPAYTVDADAAERARLDGAAG